MHLRIGTGGQDCDGRNQDRSKSAHLPHLEVCKVYTYQKRGAAFMSATGLGRVKTLGHAERIE